MPISNNFTSVGKKITDGPNFFNIFLLFFFDFFKIFLLNSKNNFNKVIISKIKFIL